MSLNRFERLAYRWFGDLAQRRAHENPRLRRSLQQAHITRRPDVYLSATYLTVTVVLVVSVLVALLLGAAATSGLVDIPPVFFLYLVPMPGLVTALVYFVNLVLPDVRAVNRARDIDARLPYAINYIATMASAGANPARIFTSLSQQPIYGEVSNEAAWISRDMSLLGHDVLTALNDAVARSPSSRFQDFLQGAVTSLTTGGDLEDYFMAKADQFLQDNRQVQQGFLESLGVLAESFVVVVVAAPLFLLVLLSVMGSLGGDPDRVLDIGYLLVLVMLPLATLGFAVTVKISTPEA